MTAPIAPTEEVDGRRLRREQNRQAVLDALVSLLEDGEYQPTSTAIAERAGISPRSLFRYFDDVDDLSRAAIERHMARWGALFTFDIDLELPLPERIRAVVEQRARLFDVIAPIARTARVTAHRNKVIGAQLRNIRGHLRTEVARVLGAGDVLPVLDALLSFESYELLRHDQHLSRDKVLDHLTGAVAALLAT
jgi:AcrR family transcriptional regulator